MADVVPWVTGVHTHDTSPEELVEFFVPWTLAFLAENEIAQTQDNVRRGAVALGRAYGITAEPLGSEVRFQARADLIFYEALTVTSGTSFSGDVNLARLEVMRLNVLRREFQPHL